MCLLDLLRSCAFGKLHLKTKEMEYMVLDNLFQLYHKNNNDLLRSQLLSSKDNCVWRGRAVQALVSAMNIFVILPPAVRR